MLYFGWLAGPSIHLPIIFESVIDLEMTKELIYSIWASLSSTSTLTRIPDGARRNSRR